MKTHTHSNSLGDHLLLTFVVRLLIDAEGGVKQGSLHAINDQASTYFKTLDELPTLIADFLRESAPDRQTDGLT